MHRARIRDTCKWVGVDNLDKPTDELDQVYNDTELTYFSSGQYDAILFNPKSELDPLTICTLDMDVKSPPVLALTGVFGKLSTLRKVDLTNLARKFAECITVRYDLHCYLPGSRSEWDTINIVVRFPYNERTKDSPFWDLTYLRSRWNMMSVREGHHIRDIPIRPVYHITIVQAYDTPEWSDKIRGSMIHHSFDFRDPMFADCEYYVMIGKYRCEGNYEYVDCDASLPIVQVLTSVVDAETASIIMSWAS